MKNVTTMVSQWQNKPTKSINSRRATHSSNTASAPGTKKPEIIYTGSEEIHLGHERFGYLNQVRFDHHHVKPRVKR